MLVNLTHHASAAWSLAQRQAALRLAAPIVDVEFPDVDPLAGADTILETARALSTRVLSIGARAAIVQGEMTLTYALVRLLQGGAVVCYAATTERVVELVVENGVTLKKSRFEFTRFRRYPEVPFDGPATP